MCSRLLTSLNAAASSCWMGVGVCCVEHRFSDDSHDSPESEVDEEIADLASLLAMNIEVRMLAALSLVTILRLVGAMLHTTRTTRARPLPSPLRSLHMHGPTGETATVAHFNEVLPPPPSTLALREHVLPTPTGVHWQCHGC
jgi:hypothetical protein